MRILFLQKRPLFPPDCGGKIRTLNVLRHLAGWHDVTYLCNVGCGERPFLKPMRDLGLRVESIPWRETPRGSLRFCGELFANLFSRFPYNVNKDYDAALRRRAAELLAENDYDLLICDFVQMARNAIGLPAPAKILFQHNVEAQIFERHSRQDSGFLRRQYMRLQYKKMRGFEAAAGRQFDRVVAVSRRDREIFERQYGWSHVDVIDTAVELEYFKPNAAVEKPGRVVFVGSMDWLPNVDGVTHFVRSIWPLIRAKQPQARFQIVGRNPAPSVRRLTAEPGVEVLGGVPDVRPYLAEAAVVVVPLLVGGGTRLKIFEALAMETPVVSTPLGAEGLAVADGEHLLLAEEPQQFADAVVRLLEDGRLRSRLSESGRQLVLQKYSSEAVARQFETICAKVVGAHANGDAGSNTATSRATPSATAPV